MRDRLIELIKNAPRNTRAFNDQYADYLLENGGLFPPVKIGQELWDIHYNRPRKWEVVYLGYNGKEWFINIWWFKDRHNFKTMQITYPFLGKMWYFTKEEAEQALRGGDEEREKFCLGEKKETEIGHTGIMVFPQKEQECSVKQ